MGLDGASSVGGSISDSIKSAGGAFCGLFVASFLLCTAVAFWYGGDWNSQRPVGIVADVSGASFAIAIVLLSVGRVLMLMTRIFRDKRKEEGRQEGKALVLRAINEKREGETIEQAIERLEREGR